MQLEIVHKKNKIHKDRDLFVVHHKTWIGICHGSTGEETSLPEYRMFKL